MGAANKVPGVSGGVVAFVAGFYEEFIYSLKKINGKAFKLLFNGRYKSFYNYINARFLGLLFFHNKDTNCERKKKQKVWIQQLSPHYT